MIRKLGLIAVMLAVFSATPAAAISPAELAKRLPRVWCGAFTWHFGGAAQYYRVTFKQVSVTANGLVAADGVAENHSDGAITRVRFRASIVAATLAITMRESDPQPPSPAYSTDGRYVGRLLSALDRIEARWIDKKAPAPEARIMLLGGPRAATFPLCAKPAS